jgi:methanogenic corrinoid protein MtbC1
VTPRTTRQRESPLGGLLSIGALSAATGIPVDTIRTWERRYGFPVAERKPSGHRVYALATVPRLRRIAQAIARGHRAAEVLPASESALEALLATTPHVPIELAPSNGSAPPPSPRLLADPRDLLDAVRAFDAEGLKRGFQADWARFGPLEFLEQRAAPFLTAVGDGWADGSLDVRHEHFASSVLGDFLRAVRVPLDDRATGPIVVLATLPGELHGLGLQMSALVFALTGWRTLVLGVDTPVEQIAVLAREAPLTAVALSCVQPRGRSAALAIRALRQRLPRRIPLIVGGAGAPSAARLAGIEIMSDLAALDRWLRSRPAA